MNDPMLNEEESLKLKHNYKSIWLEDIRNNKFNIN